MALVNKNGFANFAPTVAHGPLYSLDYDSDGSLWLPAAGGAGSIFTFVGAFTATRNASGDYSLNLTAAINSPFVVVDLSQIFDKIGSDPVLSIVGKATGAAPTVDGTAPASGVGRIKVSDFFDQHILRGVMLTSYDIVYSLATAALTTHTGTLLQTTYDASHAAGTVATKMAAAALGTATSANIIVTNVPVTVPYVLGNNASVAGTTVLSDYLEIAIVNPGTAVYKLYGIRLYFNYCLL